jgi:hypothetical protein
MLEFLYDAFSRTFRLPGLGALPMGFERRVAGWVSSRMADDIGCDETLNTALKDTYLIPGTYKDEPPCGTPRLHPPSLPRLSFPGTRIPIMAECTEICVSPIQADDCASLAESSPEALRDGDYAVEYISEESVRFAPTDSRRMGMLMI